MCHQAITSMNVAHCLETGKYLEWAKGLWPFTSPTANPDTHVWSVVSCDFASCEVTEDKLSFFKARESEAHSYQ